MKNLNEVLHEMESISDYLNAINESEVVDEGLKDILNSLKSKFKKVIDYFSKIIANIGVYWCPVNDKGEVLDAISPLTAGQAYKDGYISKDTTLVVLGNKGKLLVGLNTKPEDAYKLLYGKGSSADYWKAMGEGKLREDAPINNRYSLNENSVPTLFPYVGNDEKLMNEMISINDEDLVNEVKMTASDPQAHYNKVDNDTLIRMIKARVTNPNLAPLLIWGAPGIGKTAIMNSVVEAIRGGKVKGIPGNPEYQLIVKTLSNETPENFTLPMYIKVNGEKRATDVPKTWMPVYRPTGNPEIDKQLDDACGSGMLFIDELSRASAQVLNIILPLVNERNFNGYKLGSHWTIICASNRMEDELAGQSQIGNALANRFGQVFYEPTLNSWKKWAENQKFISPLLLQWMGLPQDSGEISKYSGGKYFYWDPNEESDNDTSSIMCTPRSWTKAMEAICVYFDTASLEGFDLINYYHEDPGMIRTALNEYIPWAAVDAFMGFIDLISKAGDLESITDKIWNSGGRGVKISTKTLNEIALPLSQLIMTAHIGKLPTEQEFESLVDWLISMKSDQLSSYVLNTLQEMLFGMIAEDHRPYVFAAAASLKRRKQGYEDTPRGVVVHKGADAVKFYEQRLNYYNKILSKLLEAYGLSSCEEIPDYLPALKKWQKSYASIQKINTDLAAAGLGELV